MIILVLIKAITQVIKLIHQLKQVQSKKPAIFKCNIPGKSN